MQKVTLEQFVTTLRSSGSSDFRSKTARYDLEMILSHHDCHIHDGDLSFPHDWQPGQANLIVLGSVNCRGLVNLAPARADVGEGGSLWVFGNFECKHFGNYYRKLLFVDGDMRVCGLAVNAFEDAALVVLGSFEAEYFKGDDVWVEAGGTISIAYGEGYGLPIGHKHPNRQAVWPRYDVKASRARLDSAEMSAERAMLKRLMGNGT